MEGWVTEPVEIVSTAAQPSHHPPPTRTLSSSRSDMAAENWGSSRPLRPGHPDLETVGGRLLGPGRLVSRETTTNYAAAARMWRGVAAWMSNTKR